MGVDGIAVVVTMFLGFTSLIITILRTNKDSDKHIDISKHAILGETEKLSREHLVQTSEHENIRRDIKESEVRVSNGLVGIEKNTTRITDDLRTIISDLNDKKNYSGNNVEGMLAALLNTYVGLNKEIEGLSSLVQEYRLQNKHLAQDNLELKLEVKRLEKTVDELKVSQRPIHKHKL